MKRSQQHREESLTNREDAGAGEWQGEHLEPGGLNLLLPGKEGWGCGWGEGKSERINACPAVGMSHAHVAASTE